MHSIVKRLKNDLGDAHLHFAVAKADSVNALERYRGKCRPCYLIYAGLHLAVILLIDDQGQDLFRTASYDEQWHAICKRSTVLKHKVKI